jgi:histidinol phosphatase-like enzyme
MTDRSITLRPALLLDLDDTVRKSRSGKQFIQGPEDIILLNEWVEPVIWQYKMRGFCVFGVTNQGGVAHGYKKLAGVLAEGIKTQEAFQRNPFDFIFVSYHDPKGSVLPFNTRSLLRKPYYGMAVQAELMAREEGAIILNWDESIMVGDRDEDKQMAKAIDVKYQHPKEFFTLSNLSQLRASFVPPLILGNNAGKKAN